MSAGREALIVAVDDYADPGLGQLRAPHRDAEALGDVLGDPRIGDFTVRVLRNETAQGIRVAVEDFFADRRPDDLLVLHFSCHGLKNAAGELFLAASDSRPTRLASTAVAADFVNQQMADSRAQRIALFLDCCYGGAFPRGMVVRASGVVEVGDAFAAAQQAAGGRGRVVVTASSSVEYAFEGGQLAPGAHVAPSVFTGSVVEGLSSGEADRDGDGWVGLNELFTYVAERVRRATPHQTPHLWAFGSEGDLLLAHSRRRRITAETLPAELTEAASSSLAATRYGVAVELRDRLLGADLGQALAAWNLLAAMKDDDSRRVSGFAISAMGQAGLHMSPAALDLGTLPIGQPGVTELRLTGSPLALAATAESADGWLRCEVDPGGVQVTAAPQAPGEYEGTIVVATPISDHQVPVRVEVVPAASVPKARSATGQPAGPLPAAVPSARPSAAQAPTPAPVAVEEAAPPADQSTGAGILPRLWWPVSAALLALGVGWVWVYASIETVWITPGDVYLPAIPLRDGFGPAIWLSVGIVVAALVWPQLAMPALGVAAGVALFFVTWSVRTFDISNVRSDESLAAHWHYFSYLGVATIAVVLLALWHRRLLRGQRWRRATALQVALVVPGSVLLVFATTLKLDYQPVWGQLALLFPVVTLALSCWAIWTKITSERGRVIVAAAVSYLVADSWAMLYVIAHVPAASAKATVWGEVLLLLALAARLGDPGWQRLNLPRRRQP